VKPHKLLAFFEYQAGSGEDGFSPITTAYAVIALQDKSLPINIFSGAPAELFDFRIEGSLEQVCAGKAAGPTALDIVKNASSLCGFTYEILGQRDLVEDRKLGKGKRN